MRHPSESTESDIRQWDTTKAMNRSVVRLRTDVCDLVLTHGERGDLSSRPGQVAGIAPVTGQVTHSAPRRAGPTW